MDKNCEKPKFIFHYQYDQNNTRPLYFGNPDEVIIATNISEVLPAMNRVEEAVNKGYYAGGFISYEAAPAFDSAYVVNQDAKLPLLWFGLFTSPLHIEETPESEQGSYQISNWQPSISFEQYQDHILQIKSAIRDGETYQVNYTMRLRANFAGDYTAFYHFLYANQLASYSAFLDIGRYKILSVSPELFFYWNKREIITKPMKGTIKRGRWAEEDITHADWLANSTKDQAENLMIVDLLRNDISRVAVTGSIEVPSMFEIEKYPTLYQMTSTVTALTRPEVKLSDIFKSLFPCGSITGAPKVNTMRYIAALEEEPREIYCGSIGLITPQGEALFNVAIRTVFVDELSGTAEYSVGGGITWDSTAVGEYDEALTKAALLTEDNRSEHHLLETFLLQDGRYVLLDQHMNRLLSSALYFSYEMNQSDLIRNLTALSEQHKQGLHRVRLLVSRMGEITLEIVPFHKNRDTNIDFTVAREPINSNDKFLYHKTTNRRTYDYHRNQHTHVFDVLLWNEREQLTEFTTGNLIAEMEGELWTPPVACGLLAGTMRNFMMSEGKIKERILTLHDMSNISKFFYANSVRGILPIMMKKEEFNETFLPM